MSDLDRAKAIEIIAAAICRRNGDDPYEKVAPNIPKALTANGYVIVGNSAPLFSWQTYASVAAAALDALVDAGLVSDALRGPA